MSQAIAHRSATVACEASFPGSRWTYHSPTSRSSIRYAYLNTFPSMGVCVIRRFCVGDTGSNCLTVSPHCRGDEVCLFPNPHVKLKGPANPIEPVVADIELSSSTSAVIINLSSHRSQMSYKLNACSLWKYLRRTSSERAVDPAFCQRVFYARRRAPRRRQELRRQGSGHPRAIRPLECTGQRQWKGYSKRSSTVHGPSHKSISLLPWTAYRSPRLSRST
jgi:hypothetical protein